MKLVSISTYDAYKNLIDHVHDRREVYDYGMKPITDDMATGAGHYVVIAGKTVAGKSLLALQICKFMAASGLKTAYISLEMSTASLARRLLAASGTMAALKAGDATDYQVAQMEMQARRDKNLPLDLVNGAGASVADVEEYIADHPDVRVVCVDYLQMMRPTERYASKAETIADTSTRLAALAHRTGVTIIALGQLLMKGEAAHGEPDLESIMGSSQIAQDADGVLLLWLEDDRAYSGRRIIKIGKNRDGVAGRKYWLDFDGLHMQMTLSRDQHSREPASSRPQFKTLGRGKDRPTKLVPLPTYEQDELPL